MNKRLEQVGAEPAPAYANIFMDKKIEKNIIAIAKK